MILNENVTFSFENWLLDKANPEKKGCQIIEFCASEDIYNFSNMEKFIEDFYEVFPMDYGFIFSLPSNYDPFSERKIKYGFFSESITVDAKDRLWTQNIQHIRNGLLKDIYPINFINNTVYRNVNFQEQIMEI